MARILIIDDERNCREVLREALVDDGFDVECAENPTQAMEVALRTEPDVVVTDLYLRNVSDGADVARAILEIVPKAEIIAMSAMPVEEVNRRFSSVHPLAILHKPFAITQLEAAIHTALAGSPDAP